MFPSPFSKVFFIKALQKAKWTLKLTQSLISHVLHYLRQIFLQTIFFFRDDNNLQMESLSEQVSCSVFTLFQEYAAITIIFNWICVILCFRVIDFLFMHKFFFRCEFSYLLCIVQGRFKLFYSLSQVECEFCELPWKKTSNVNGNKKNVFICLSDQERVVYGRFVRISSWSFFDYAKLRIWGGKGGWTFLQITAADRKV